MPNIALALAVPTEIPFTATVPGGGLFYSQPQSVSGPLAFSIQPDSIRGSNFVVDLTADGAHIPTFPGMTAAPGSMSWVNTIGVVHSVGLSNGGLYGAGLAYSIQVNSMTPIPAISSISVAPGTNPVITIAIGGSNLVPTSVPNITDFSLSFTPGPLPFSSSARIAAVSVSATAVEVALTGNVVAGDTIALSYTPNAAGGSAFPFALQDASQNFLAAFVAAPVTVT